MTIHILSHVSAMFLGGEELKFFTLVLNTKLGKNYLFLNLKIIFIPLEEYHDMLNFKETY